jgi:PucR family transcriptional regulator, purine catabolism regulatory protein
MTVTIRSLVAETDLRLTLRGDTRGLDQEVGWVAVSELPDPTPWLQGAELLLTSGMWLGEVTDRARTADEWAGRLAQSGARAIGFGLEPWFTAVPAEIVKAATRHRLTLLEIPPETPFVAIDRRVADLHTAEARRREADVVRSQQRLAAAARSGTSAVVRTLSRELRGWVVTLDAAHRVDHRTGELDGLDLDQISGFAIQAASEARRSLLTGEPAQPMYLVPIGDWDNRQGTLCVDGRSIKTHTAQRAGLVGTAAAILSVISPATHAPVQEVVVDLLLEGDYAGARRICEAAGLRLPERLVAVSLGGSHRQQAMARAVALGMWPLPGKHSTDPVVLAEPSLVEARLTDLLEQTGARAGISTTHPPVDVRRASQEAASAQRLTDENRRVAHYTHLSSPNLETLLATEAAREFAEQLLAPLAGHPERDRLLASATAWVQANGRWDPAAAALRIHRVTLRARLRRLADIVGLELDSAYDRLALSLALEALPAGGLEDNPT